MSEITGSTAVRTQGDIDPADVEYAREKVERALGHMSSPTLDIEIKLTHAPDPARERPCFAEASADVNGTVVRAHVAAHEMRAAVDLLQDRLANQVQHLADRTRHPRRVPRHADAEPHSWRHAGRPTERPEHFARPVDDRELVRRKSFADGDLTPDEAADTLDLLGHDFFLFHHLGTDADAVLWSDDDGELVLVDASGADTALDGTVTPIRRGEVAAEVCTVAEATERLDLGLEPFVFFVDTETERGCVVYHRYDGHYGLVTLA